jgi:hypothetical protein
VFHWPARVTGGDADLRAGDKGVRFVICSPTSSQARAVRVRTSTSAVALAGITLVAEPP